MSNKKYMSSEDHRKKADKHRKKKIANVDSPLLNPSDYLAYVNNAGKLSFFNELEGGLLLTRGVLEGANNSSILLVGKDVYDIDHANMHQNQVTYLEDKIKKNKDRGKLVKAITEYGHVLAIASTFDEAATKTETAPMGATLVTSSRKMLNEICEKFGFCGTFIEKCGLVFMLSEWNKLHENRSLLMVVIYLKSYIELTVLLKNQIDDGELYPNLEYILADLDKTLKKLVSWVGGMEDFFGELEEDNIIKIESKILLKTEGETFFKKLKKTIQRDILIELGTQREELYKKWLEHIQEEMGDVQDNEDWAKLVSVVSKHNYIKFDDSDDKILKKIRRRVERLLKKNVLLIEDHATIANCVNEYLRIKASGKVEIENAQILEVNLHELILRREEVYIADAQILEGLVILDNLLDLFIGQKLGSKDSFNRACFASNSPIPPKIKELRQALEAYLTAYSVPMLSVYDEWDFQLEAANELWGELALKLKTLQNELVLLCELINDGIDAFIEAYEESIDQKTFLESVEVLGVMIENMQKQLLEDKKRFLESYKNSLLYLSTEDYHELICMG